MPTERGRSCAHDAALTTMRDRDMNVSQRLLFLALAGVSSAAMAADAERTPPDLTTFVKKAAQDGMTEVEVGKLALSKSQDPAIRGFAQKMVDDHSKANAELAQIAEAKGVTPPKKLDAEHQAMVSSMKNVAAADFDRQYSKHMNMDHSKAIALFESASKADDPQLAEFAQKTLPTLKVHKQMAEKLPANSGSSTTPGG
jgi:putative membrane protein